MVENEEFELIRAEICASGPASDGDSLLGMEIDCCFYFGDPDYADAPPNLWSEMKIRRSASADWLISGRALGKRDEAAAIATELSELWNQRLRYRYRSAHTVNVSSECVMLRAVTQMGPNSLWVTAQVEVTLA